jgi:SagB-type dehydrogenase family enzyme
MLPADDSVTLARLYHLNSQVRSGEGTPPEEWLPRFRCRIVSTEDWTTLTPPVTALTEILRRRRSVRQYTISAMPEPAFATLVFGAVGQTGIEEYVPGLALLRRVAPSAGGLCPVDIFAITERVEGLADGLHRVDWLSQTVHLLRAGCFMDTIRRLFINQDCAVGANVVLVFAATFQDTLAKYGARGYRYILLETGHAAQNVCLVATEMGLGSVCIGGFDDDEMNAFLGLDGVECAALYCIVCGYPS